MGKIVGLLVVVLLGGLWLYEVLWRVIWRVRWKAHHHPERRADCVRWRLHPEHDCCEDQGECEINVD